MKDRDDELLRHIGTLWKTAMVGLGTLREVAVRSTQSGRLRVDIALLQRERSQLLETLGEMVVSMIDEGSFEDVPESVKQAYDRIKDVQTRIQHDDARAHDNAFGAPRGYEPEAASDYGDDTSATSPDDEAGADDQASPPETPPHTHKKTTPNGKRKVTHR